MFPISPMDYLKVFAIVFAAGVATSSAFVCLLLWVVRHDHRLW